VQKCCVCEATLNSRSGIAFEHSDFRSALAQVPRNAESGKPGSEDNDAHA
jgi:hypothetical protein